MRTLSELIDAVASLSREDLRQLSSRVLELLSIGSTNVPDSDVCIDTCRKCESRGVVKYGRDKNGKQRYKCKNCGTIFYSTSFSVVSRTRSSLTVWKQYVELLLAGASLAQCAKTCNISMQTAFSWRHKILNALQKDQASRLLGGIVEADETYVAISYKGNRSKSKGFTMPRAAHKRGTDDRAQTGSRACVMLACERNGQVYGEVLGKGQPTIAMLSHAFNTRLIPESIVLSDKSISTKNYFNRNTSVQLIQLMAHVRPKSMNSPPEVRGVWHIQNVNNLHARFRKFLRSYNGVSTKYLNHYLSLFVWIDNHKKLEATTLESSLASALTHNHTYAPQRLLVSLPVIPRIA